MGDYNGVGRRLPTLKRIYDNIFIKFAGRNVTGESWGDGIFDAGSYASSGVFLENSRITDNRGNGINAIRGESAVLFTGSADHFAQISGNGGDGIL